MELAGLSLPELLAVLGTAWALTLALYLLKLRRRRVPVSFIPLWESLLADRQASQLFRRVQHLASLLIALTVVALLSVAWSDPQPNAPSAGMRHILLLIDSGVTMGARDVAPSRLERALAIARKLARSASPSTRMLVTQLDAGVTPLSAFSAEPHELEQALDQVRPSDLASDIQHGFRYAFDALRGRSSGEIILLSDAPDAPEPELARALQAAHIDWSRIPIGRRSDDVGISAFALRRYPLDRNRSELLVELYSAAPHAEQVELTLLGDDAPIDVQRLTLEPGKSAHRVYDDVTGVGRTLEARLRVEGDHDDLAANDRAFATVPDRRRLRVLCVSEGNRYLEAGLLLDEYLDVDVVTPARYAASAGYDVVIFDRFVPPSPPATPALFIEPQGQGPAQPFEVIGRLDRPRFEHVERDHPVLRFTALHDVNVASALLVRPGPADRVLAADPRGALIVAGRRGDQPFVALNFDLQASDLPLRVAWPLLLLNSIDWFSGSNNEYIPSATVGRPTRVSLPDGVESVRLSAPDASTRTLRAERGVLSFTPNRAGFQRVTWPGGERLVAVNLDPDTRRVLTPGAPRRVMQAARPQAGFVARGLALPVWMLLLLLAICVLVAEWISYHRRITV